MARDHLQLTIGLLATVWGCLNVYGKGGGVIEKQYDWSPLTEAISAKEFAQQATRGALETGYKEYFIGTDGKRFSVERTKIAKVIFYPEVDAYTDLQNESQLSPILADISELKALAARYPLARRYLDRQVAKLENEVSLFRQGARKISGVWHSAAEIARQRQEAADREARLEAARKAEEERLAAIRAEEERAAVERKAAAETRYGRRFFRQSPNLEEF